MSIINVGNMRESVADCNACIAANGNGKHEIGANEDDGGDAQKAAEVTAAILAHADVAAFAGVESESGAGIVTALREAAKNADDIVATAMEQTPDFFKAAKEGWVNGIVVQNRELFIY